MTIATIGPTLGPTLGPRLHADWIGCRIEDFATLQRDELEELEPLLAEHIIYRAGHYDGEEERRLNTLRSKLLFLIHNSY